MVDSAKEINEVITIPAPNLQIMDIYIKGTAPFVQHRFSKKTATQMLGSTAKGKKKHEARDIEQDYRDAMHMGEDDKCGIPAPAFRSAMISACKLVGFQMTRAKLSIFIIADSVDKEDGSPLVHIQGEPELHRSGEIGYWCGINCNTSDVATMDSEGAGALGCRSIHSDRCN